VIGPVVVTVLGPSSVAGDEELIEADSLRFVGRYVSIEVTGEATRFFTSVPLRRLVRIDGRD
jgi:hypothetical protein